MSEQLLRKYGLYVFLLFVALWLVACSPSRVFEEQDGPPSEYVDVSNVPDATPKPELKSRYGNPPSYVVRGQQYHVLDSSEGYHATGIASWYGTKFNKKRTSSGEIYDMYKMTAANTVLPIPTYVRVTNLENGRQAVVKVNDRGPFEQNRLIDLSYAAASKLEMLGKGTALVSVDAVTPGVPEEAADSTPRYSQPMIYLQVGAYSDRAHAEAVEDKINQVVPAPCKLYPGNVQDKIIYRVQVGPIADVATSDRITGELKAVGFSQPVTLIKDTMV